MIDQDLINKCQSDLDDFGSLMKCQATELLANYISLIEQNAELHKQNEKNKSDANKLYELCANSGVCPEFLKVNFAN